MAEPARASMQRDFAAHLRDPDRVPAPPGLDDARMQVYRELVFNNLRGLLGAHYRISRRVLGPQRWEALIRAFLQRHRCRTPYFFKLPGELLAFVQQREDGDDPPFLAELMHYEWMQLELRLAELEPVSPAAAAAGPDAEPLDGVPVFAPGTQLLSYSWPVHGLSPRHQPAQAPAQPTFLLIYRNADERVRHLELNALTALLLELLMAEAACTVAQAIDRLLEQAPGLDAAAVRGGAAALLAQLRDLGVISGHRGPA